MEAPSPRRRRGLRPSLMLGVGVSVLVLATAFMILATDAGLPQSSAHDASTSSRAAAVRGKPEFRATPHPTPAVAEFRGAFVYLPISPTDVTAIGFHQASGGKAFAMRSLCPDAKMTSIAAAHTDATRSARAAATVWTSDTAGTPTFAASTWAGDVLRMWRNRPGKPDTAFDCGAPYGTLVLAPVSGVVTQVKAYKLYGKYPDFELHIAPAGLPNVDGVLIHVTDVKIKAGDLVVGGLTPVGRVRRLSDRLTTQLATYTGEAGDHVHFQLNKPQKKGETATSTDGS